MSAGYKVSVTTIDGNIFEFSTEPGSITFGLGANGTGKSSFVSLLSQNNTSKVTRLAGNREITLASPAIGITGAVRADYEQVFKNELSREKSRYYTAYSRNITDSIAYDLKEKETNFISNHYHKLAQSNEGSEVEKQYLNNIRRILSPLKMVQDILSSGGLHFNFFYDDKGILIAQRTSGSEVSVNMLSDGERAAFLMASRVITAPEGQLILLDEPERHLHRSISTPLIRAILDYREDCSFMIVTHDLSLPRDFPDSQILLFREFVHPNKWRIEQIDDLSEISEDVAEAILGSKDKLLFVEGQKK